MLRVCILALAQTFVTIGSLSVSHPASLPIAPASLTEVHEPLPHLVLPSPTPPPLAPALAPPPAREAPKPTPAATAAPTPAPAPPAAAPAPARTQPPCGNHFARGYCTYWVAAQRCVPWYGDAWQWLNAAARDGFHESRSPVEGAIAVWWKGQGGAGGYGHVAYVERVNVDGTILVSEMNWGGYNRVSRRTISASVVAGFILP